MTTPVRSRRAWMLAPLCCLVASACAVVRHSYVRPDYASVDKYKVKRLAVVVQPYPANDPQAGELWSLIARRYVNQKRQFIVKQNLAFGPANEGEAPFDPKPHCGGDQKIEGVLWLQPTANRAGDGQDVSVKGVLIRCSDGQEIWNAEAGGHWPSHDEGLKEVTAEYVSEVGKEVEPFVVPAFRLLKATLDTLPDPVLDDADKDEKIELGE